MLLDVPGSQPSLQETDPTPRGSSGGGDTDIRALHGRLGKPQVVHFAMRIRGGKPG